MSVRLIIASVIVVSSVYHFAVPEKKNGSSWSEIGEQMKQTEARRVKVGNNTCQIRDKAKEAQKTLSKVNGFAFDEAADKRDAAEKVYDQAVSKVLSKGVDVSLYRIGANSISTELAFTNLDSSNDCYGTLRAKIVPDQNVIKVLKDLPEYPHMTVRIYGTATYHMVGSEDFNITVSRIEFPNGDVLTPTPSSI